MAALSIENFVDAQGLKPDGSLTTPLEFNNFVIKFVIDEIVDLASQDKPWKYDPNIRGIKYTPRQINGNIYVETAVYAKVKKTWKI